MALLQQQPNFFARRSFSQPKAAQLSRRAVVVKAQQHEDVLLRRWVGGSLGLGHMLLLW